MSLAKDRSFWIAQGKSAAGITLGSIFATVVLGVPAETTATFAAGAIVLFPSSYALGMRHPTRSGGSPGEPIHPPAPHSA